MAAARTSVDDVLAAVASSETARLGLHLLTVAHGVEKILDEQMTAGGLSLARWRILIQLHDRVAIRQKTLADKLGYAERTVTQAVESLASDGLVDRTADPADRRAKLVVLTDEGAAALAAGTRTGTRVLEGLFGTLSERQRTELARLLNRLGDTTAER
ncbi:DNA-binding MarR family transcriptional regulator [Mycobacterium sp. MAA66]|uniref:MarR family winged helix-turn-helix transcriptional regulator n=1 Tax=Mycobacterium sp. MAA66 TaxID=3156297 RepID=UPI003518FB99